MCNCRNHLTLFDLRSAEALWLEVEFAMLDLKTDKLLELQLPEVSQIRPY